MLVEVKKFLEVSEAEMIRRWATQKAANLVVGIVIAITLLAAFSYGIGYQVSQPVWQGDMALSLNLPENQPAPTAASWAISTRQIVMGEPVLKESLSQLEQRGIRLFNSTQALADHLDKQLTISGQPGKIELAYQTQDKDLCVPLLESVGRAIVGFQLAQDRLANRKDTIQIARAAKRLPDPVRDDRLKITGITFSILLGICLVAWLLLRTWLKRTQRMFGIENAPELEPLSEPAG